MGSEFMYILKSNPETLDSPDTFKGGAVAFLVYDRCGSLLP